MPHQCQITGYQCLVYHTQDFRKSYVQDQLYDVFQPLFLFNMSGSLRGHSCCTALVKMVDDWRLALDSKKVSDSIAIDLSKAFDSICHNLLLTKLRVYGVDEEAFDFLHSYLSGRK